MNRSRLLWTALALALLAASPAAAQTYRDTGGTAVPGVVVVDPTDNSGPVFSVSNPAHVTGTFSASLGTFTQSTSGAIGTPISATTSGATGTLPTGASVLLVNTSTSYGATCAFGTSDAGAAYYVPAAQSQEIGVPSGSTQIHCTGIGGTAQINMIGGSGIFAGAGGGGGSGGGGTVTQGPAGASAWLVTGAGGTFPVTGTFWQATQPVSGALTANAGTNLNTSALALESGGNLAGINSLIGAKTDAKSTATDATSVSAMQVWKEISALEQAPASRAVTNAGTFAVQAAESGTWTVTGAGGTFPVTGTFWQATQPVSVASLPLPTGAAQETGGDLATAATNAGTVATNTTRTNAGTSAATALPIQGVTGGVAVPVTGTFWQSTQPVSLSSLPAYAATPTFNLGTLNGAATDAHLTNVQSSPGSSAATAVTVQGSATGVALPVTPKTGAFTYPGCTVGTSSAQCLAGSTATNHIQLQNESASATIYCAWGATAIANAAGSFQLAAGQSALWGPTTAGVPSAALNCISTAASTPLYLDPEPVEGHPEPVEGRGDHPRRPCAPLRRPGLGPGPELVEGRARPDRRRLRHQSRRRPRRLGAVRRFLCLRDADHPNSGLHAAQRGPPVKTFFRSAALSLCAAVALTLSLSKGEGQTVTSIPGAYPSSAPSGYTTQNFDYNCASSICWPNLHSEPGSPAGGFGRSQRERAERFQFLLQPDEHQQQSRLAVLASLRRSAL